MVTENECMPVTSVDCACHNVLRTYTNETEILTNMYEKNERFDEYVRTYEILKTMYEQTRSFAYMYE